MEWLKRVGRVAAALLAVTAASGYVGVPASWAGGAQGPAAKTYTVPELVKLVKLAVVYIGTFDQRGEQEGLGSGFVVDASGTIVTNLHVIAGASAVVVKMADGEVYDRVEVVDYDDRRDIAVLKVRPFGALPTVTLGNSDELEVGEQAVAIGNPQGLEHTVSTGVISAVRQAEGFRQIQTSAPISPGSSGGPLFDMHGRVIGITSAAVVAEHSQNLNLAVPINYVKPMLQTKTPAISIVELNKKIGATPGQRSSGAAASGLSSDVVWWANVAHDHVGGNFEDICFGRLYVGADRVGYATESGLHNWEVPLEAVKEVKKNVFSGAKYQAFHITLKTGSNYNLVVVDEDQDPIAPDEVIFLLLKSLDAAR